MTFVTLYLFQTGRTALHEAASSGHESAVRLLLENGAHIGTRTILAKETALHIASANGHDIICRILLRRGSDVNSKNKYGYTPLHFCKNVRVAEALLEKRADPYIRNKFDQTAEEVVSENEHLDHDEMLKLVGVLREAAVNKLRDKYTVERRARAAIRLKQKEENARKQARAEEVFKRQVAQEYRRWRK